ncbi:hypothetical protein [Desmospora activa]|nr:hypothetical protein [Desmospora activa]
MELLEHRKECTDWNYLHTAKVKISGKLMTDFKPDVKNLEWRSR